MVLSKGYPEKGGLGPSRGAVLPFRRSILLPGSVRFDSPGMWLFTRVRLPFSIGSRQLEGTPSLFERYAMHNFKLVYATWHTEASPKAPKDTSISRRSRPCSHSMPGVDTTI